MELAGSTRSSLRSSGLLSLRLAAQFGQIEVKVRLAAEV